VAFTAPYRPQFLQIWPPLVITEAEVDELLLRLGHAVRDAADRDPALQQGKQKRVRQFQLLACSLHWIYFILHICINILAWDVDVGIRILKSKTLIPLLFVHGHIGSHQQVRSLASESSRELVRRLQNKDSKWDVWIEWNAVDLASQPSAFEPRILV